MRAGVVAIFVVVVATSPTIVRADAPAALATSQPGTLGEIARRHVLRVGMYPGLTPFVAVGADADELLRLTHATTPPVHATDGRAVAGFDVDLAAAAARALGVQARDRARRQVRRPRARSRARRV